MHRKGFTTVFLILFLVAGTFAPLVVESSGPDEKGNSFVRVVTAPFRALGRLFGSGGRKKDAAKKRKQGGEQNARRAQKPAQTAQQAPATDERRGDVPGESRSSAPGDGASETNGAAVAAEPESTLASAVAIEAADVAAAAAVAAVAAPAAARTSEGARVVRPAEGATAPAASKWVPVIEGISKDPLTQGRALLTHGYPNEAISELSIAAVVGADLVEANNLLGIAYDRLGRHKQAIEAYDRALTAAPDNAEVLNNYGYSLFLDGRAPEALKRLKRAKKLTPSASYVHANIAVVKAKLGKYDDAFKSFKRAYGDYEARVKTAELLEEVGRTDDALKHYESARKLRPDSPALLERLAALYERKGRARDAEAARRAIGNPPNKQKTATGGGG